MDGELGAGSTLITGQTPGPSSLPGGAGLLPTAGGLSADVIQPGGANDASNTSWLNTDWGKLLLQLGIGLAGAKLLGGPTGAQSSLRDFATSGFGSSNIQRFLPLSLQKQFTEPILASGIGGIGDLIRNPGGLSPTVNQAIAPQLANESQAIAQNYRNLQSNQAGSLARSNAPPSIKTALQSALGISQERAQREARNQALTESDVQRRNDLNETFKILDALLQFTSSGRGQAIQGLGAASQQSQQNRASQLALLGSILSGSMNG